MSEYNLTRNSATQRQFRPHRSAPKIFHWDEDGESGGGGDADPVAIHNLGFI